MGNTQKKGQLTPCNPYAQPQNQSHTGRPQRVWHSAIRWSNMGSQQGLISMCAPRRCMEKDKILSGIQIIPNLCTVCCKVVQHQELMCRFGQAKADKWYISLIEHASELQPCQGGPIHFFMMAPRSDHQVPRCRATEFRATQLFFFAQCCLGKVPGGAPFSQLHKGNGIIARTGQIVQLYKPKTLLLEAAWLNEVRCPGGRPSVS